MLSISAVEGWVLTSFRLCRTQPEIHEHQGQTCPIPYFPELTAWSALPNPEVPPQLPCSGQSPGSGLWNCLSNPPGKAPTNQTPALPLPSSILSPKPDAEPPTVESSEVPGRLFLFLLFPGEFSSWDLSTLFWVVLPAMLDMDEEPNKRHRLACEGEESSCPAKVYKRK